MNNVAQDGRGLVISPGRHQHIRPKVVTSHTAYGQNWHNPQRVIVSSLPDKMIGVGR